MQSSKSGWVFAATTNNNAVGYCTLQQYLAVKKTFCVQFFQETAIYTKEIYNQR